MAITASSIMLDPKKKPRSYWQCISISMKLMMQEARKLLEQGDVRGAAEKAYAAYKSFLGVPTAKHIDKLEAHLARKIEVNKEKGLQEAKWWVERGLEIPSRAVGPIASILSKVTE